MIEHHTSRRARRQPLAGLQQNKTLMTKLCQSASRDAEPKIPFVILADGAHVVGPAAFVEHDLLEIDAIEAEDTASAGADPESSFAAFTKTPDPHRSRLFAGEIVDPFAFS